MLANIHPCQYDNLVLGEGPQPARMMIVGEAGGSTERSKGRPFCGQSGELLSNLIKWAGWRRADIYITNILKHTPPKNKFPVKKVVTQCLPYLEEEFKTVQPEIVLLVGGKAVSYLLPKVKLEMEHGKPRRAEMFGRQVIAVPLYHPAYVFRSPQILQVLVEDFQALPKLLDDINKPITVPQYYLGKDLGSMMYLTRFPAPEIGFDVETTAPKRHNVFLTDEADIVGFSWSPMPGLAAYVDGKPTYFAALLEDPTITKVCHNTKFEYKLLKKMGVTLANWEDTKLAAYLLGFKQTSLKTLTYQLLNRRPVTFDEMAMGRDPSAIPADQIKDYAAADADNTISLWPILRDRLVSEGLWSVYEKIEKPLVPVLAKMEKRGLLVDKDQLACLSTELQTLISESADSLIKAGFTGNPNSRPQLTSWLLENGAPLRKKTVTGLLQTDEAALVVLERSGWKPDFLAALKSYRMYSKLKSTYVEAWLELLDKDSTLHTSFNQAGSWEDGDDTAAPQTGRLSSSGPNLQNVGKEKYPEWSKKLRRCVIARPGYVFVVGDASQEEARILAHLSQDPNLLADVASGDVHSAAAKRMYGVWPEKGSKQRFAAKTINLGVSYGAEWRKVQETAWLKGNIKLTDDEAKHAIDSWRKSYSVAWAWLTDIKATAKRLGYATTYFGRKRYLHSLYSPKLSDRQAGEREAGNVPIQGTAADLLKMALVNLDNSFTRYGLSAGLTLTTHDDIMDECLEVETNQVATLLSGCLNDLIPGLKLPVEVKVGRNWADLKTYEHRLS